MALELGIRLLNNTGLRRIPLLATFNFARPLASKADLPSSRQLNCLLAKNLNIKMYLQSPVGQQSSFVQVRSYAEKEELTVDLVTERVMINLRLFDKIDAEKLTLDSHFINDLGLDSLDQVEIIVTLEEDFWFEIPDADSERLMTPRAIIDYICDKYDLY